MKKIIYFLFVILCSTAIYPQPFTKKFEFRGVWIASLGIDWPAARGTSASDINAQKDQLLQIFDAHKSYGMNAMLLHVRPKCDAAYKSSIEPWSRYITGQDGLAPSDPNYDPLQFAVAEAHKRGMELHAWLNPFRANGDKEDPTILSAQHIVNKHPEWVIKCNGTEYRFINPGLPEARDYVVKVIMDIVRRYDVDGIHFDDYFYPYSSYGSFNDDATFNKYKGSFTDRTSWRINNVNLLIQAINDSIKSVKPWVKFGVSPHMSPSENKSLFCDPFAWLKGDYVDTTGVAHTGTPYVDYVLPQLYGAQYANALPTWTGVTNGRHLFSGMPAHLYNGAGFTANELGWEVMTNRTVPAVSGGVFYSSKWLTVTNAKGCADSLKHNYFVYPAITPKMNWVAAGNSTKPNAPTNFRLEKNNTTGKYEFKWNKPLPAANGDTAQVYVVYRFSKSPSAADLEDPTKMLGYTGQTFLSENECHFSVTSGDYYVVTAFDHYSNESAMSNVVQANLSSIVPGQVILNTPVNNDKSQLSSALLKWNAASLANSYQLQVARDSLFTQVVTNYFELKSASAVAPSIVPGLKYYWRVKAFNLGGSSPFSQAFSFESAIASYPVTAEPVHRSTNVSLNPVLKWYKEDKATSYRVRVSTSALMTTDIFFDQTVNDTLVGLTGLSTNKFYYWQVKSINSYGQSDYGTTMGFKTGTGTAVEKDGDIVKEYKLDQNYPNPFNPSTKITYSIAKDGHVKLSVYNVLGKEIAVLVDKNQSAGRHSVMFSSGKFGESITTGIYFYTIRSGNYVSTRKMMIIK